MNASPSVRDDFERLASRYICYQFFILAALVGLSVLNEVADLPHFWFGAPPTTSGTRWAEVIIEAGAFGVVAALQIIFLRTLRRKIRVLHGLIPICDECGKVHHNGQWLHLEQLISDLSMAFFHHTTCPECREPGQAKTQSEKTLPASTSGSQSEQPFLHYEPGSIAQDEIHQPFLPCEYYI